MADVLSSILWFFVAISVLVAVHEYGHYIVGRWTGMKVLKFSIGFGKPLWSRVAGPDRTEYAIATIPLGGYVRFLDSREAAVSPEDDGRAFDQRPIWQRIAVLAAGPFFNFLFAIVAYWALFIYGVPSLIPAVGQIEPGSFAEEAGLQTGDRIIAVDGREIRDWEGTLLAMIDQMVSENRIDMRVESADGNLRTATLLVGDAARGLTEPGTLFDGLGFQPWNLNDVEIEDLASRIGNFEPDSSAQAAGLQVGDQIVEIDGQPVSSFADLVRVVTPLADQTVNLSYERDGQRFDTRVDIGNMERDGEIVGRLGIYPLFNRSDYEYLRQYGAGESVGQALQRTWDSTVFTVTMLGRMVTGDVSIKNISGPINIAQFAGESADRGLDRFLSFMAIVSISLGVLNLLPIPILDGGQIVYQTIEGIKGSPMSERAQIFGQQVGLFALLMLMSFAFYNDITRLFE